MTKDELANMIEDYATAKLTGRASVIAPFAKTLNTALDELFPASVDNVIPISETTETENA